MAHLSKVRFLLIGKNMAVLRFSRRSTLNDAATAAGCVVQSVDDLTACHSLPDRLFQHLLSMLCWIWTRKKLFLSSPPCALTADSLLPSVAITRTNQGRVSGRYWNSSWQLFRLHKAHQRRWYWIGWYQVEMVRFILQNMGARLRAKCENEKLQFSSNTGPGVPRKWQVSNPITSC